MCIHFSMPYRIKKKASKLLSEGRKIILRELESPGGAYPQISLDDCSLLCVKPEPHHFCRAFPALVCLTWKFIRTTCHSVAGIGMIIDRNNVQNSVGFGGA